MKKLIAIVLIILGVLSFIMTIINMQVTVGDAEAFLAGQVALPVPPGVTWGLYLIQAVGLVYLIFAENFKKTNLLWIIISPVGCLVLGTRQLLKLNKSSIVEIN